MRDPGRKIAVFAVLVVAGLAACNAGGRVESAWPPLDYDPCVLVTKADAEALLGQAVTSTKSESADPRFLKACVYGAKSGTSTKSVKILLQPRSSPIPLGMAPDRDLWKAKKRSFQEKGDPIQPVAGLGKDAFVEPSGVLNVLTEKIILSILVDGFTTDAQNADAEKALAQKALSRM
jgi:hypothetical protein